MKKTNAIIKDWKERCENLRYIVFNITIDKSDFDEMVTEIETLQNENEQLKKLGVKGNS